MQKAIEAKSVGRLLADAKSARRKGAEAAAQAIYREILDRYPGNRTARTALAGMSMAPKEVSLAAVLQLFKRRRYAESLEAAEDYLKTDAGNTTALVIQATCYSMTGQPEPALEIYWKLLAENRENADLWQKAGNTLFEMMRIEDAVDCLKIATQLAPDNVENWMALARFHQNRGEYAKAYEALSQTLGRDSTNCQGLIQLGTVLLSLGKTELAEAAISRALKVASSSSQRAAAANAMGTIRSSMGDKASARDYFRRAIRDDPNDVRASYNLSRMPEDGVDDDLPDRMRRQLNEPGLTAMEKSQTHFALFGILDRRGDDPETAFDHLRQGNDLRRNLLRHNPDQPVAHFAFLKELSAETPVIEDAEEGIRPIFIVGMPRSGTTLTEQMLSAAPDVYAGGEMTVAERFSHTMTRAVIKSEQTRLSEMDIRQFANSIRAGLTAQARGASVVLDKMPLNFRWAGLLLAAMPDARIINIRRDPIENCWSNYKVSYGTQGNSFAYGLSDLASFYHLYLDLTAHWETLFPDRFQTIHYEALVNKPEPVLRDLVAFCALDWSDDCLHPERSQRTILTASEQQVRKPVYNGNKGDWRRYEAFLGPLIDGLSETGTRAAE